jgi:hypothetical protein
MTFFLVALAAGLLGAVPLLVARHVGLAAIVAAGGAVFGTLWFYWIPPSLPSPFWGGVGVLVVLLWIGSGALASWLDEERSRALWFGVVGILALFTRSCSGSAAFHAREYASLLGTVHRAEWTDTTQPKDPKHKRLVPLDLARWMADKQLGEASGAIGSQFHVDKEHMTIQLIHDELWYVAPLDFSAYSVWSSVGKTPGYVMVSGEDPNRQPKVVTGLSFRYMPGAYFGNEIYRYLWTHGYSGYDLDDYTFEIDEEGKPWWVVTLTKPSIAWWGDRVAGVVVLDPDSGATTFHAMGHVPSWIDRVMPADVVDTYVADHGSLSGGWLNSWWGKLDLTTGQSPSFIHGSDGQPYWVSEITSTGRHDLSLLGLMYTNARTGAVTYYKAKGALDRGVLSAVDGKVSYRKWHGDSPVIYNLYGTMGSIVPLLSDGSNVFQGVAIVDIAKPTEVAVGENFDAALREYQKLLGQNGNEATPELAQATKTVEGTLARFASGSGTQGTTYYVVIDGAHVIFTGGVTLSPKLPLAKPGDRVRVTYIDSPEDVVPMQSFDDLSLPLGKAAGETHDAGTDAK